ncbi:MAG: hypothetical protein VB067_01920 [Christensenellaceae bacterium]|nr:hypothetical protein [Christensenellaceae bacterium]
MIIVHLCLANFFVDDYSYQENMLPKYHKLLGHDVKVIASLVTFDAHGQVSYLPSGGRYINEYDIPVTRLEYRGNLRLARRFRRYVGAYEALEQEAPDVLFIHGCQFVDIRHVVRYLKAHPGVRVYVDNHADFSNSARNLLSKYVLHRIVWRRCARLIEPYARKFYGVLPARVDFLKHVYGVNPDKVELLVMGADDEAVEASRQSDARSRIRQRYGIGADDFLIMTGGKIDAFKTQTLKLMEAVLGIARANVKLIVFGSVIPEMQQKVDALTDHIATKFIGWVPSQLSYDHFAAADLVVFPGRHSVFWEQVCGQGIPLMVKKWAGTTHVDVGGNVIFLTEDSEKEMREKILELLDRPEALARMRQVAEREGMKRFSYRGIALRSIEEHDESTGARRP